MPHARKSLGLFVYVLALMLLPGPVQAEEPYQVAWTAKLGTSIKDNSRSVAVDSSGNAYITGWTWDGGNNASDRDAFLSKFDSLFNELWTNHIDPPLVDYCYSVAVDGFGNAYITGETNADLGGTSTEDSDAILVKYNSSGTELWSRLIGTSNGAGYSVAVDGSGNAYITGSTLGDLGGVSAGGYDAFLAKYDSLGNKLWTSQIGTSYDDRSRSIAVDGSGNAYISGYTRGDLGGTNEGYEDAFLVKYDSLGNELWSQQIGTSDYDDSYSVAVDGSGNAYISGVTQGDLGGTNSGSADTYLTKFDSLGNELWSRQFGSSESDYGHSVAVDGSGNAYITGSTRGEIGGINAGGADTFLVKYDTSGNLRWSHQIGTASNETSYSVAVDGSGNPYITGMTDGDLGGTNAGDNDAFLIKFEVPEPASAMLLAIGSPGLLMRRRK